MTHKPNPTKRKHLDFSRPFYAYSVHESDEVDAVLDELFEVVASSSRYERRPKRESVMPCVQAIALDVYRAHSSNRRLHVAMPLGAVKWTGTDRYKPIQLGRDPLSKVVKALEEQGLISTDFGYQNPDGIYSRVTRIRAKPELIRLFREKGVKPSLIRDHPDSETIILKDKKKKRIDYPDTPDTLRMRSNLKQINEQIASTHLNLKVSDVEMTVLLDKLRNKDKEEGENDQRQVDFTSITLSRVFNNESFEEGGRFYGTWWQAIPSDYRKFIQIEHKDVVEVDYSGMHIAMLYAREGLELPDDPYTLTGVPLGDEWRSRLKIALQIILNADSKAKALGAIERDMGDAPLPPAFANWKELVDAFKKRHKPIAKHFHTGEGVRLQFEDSEIAESVMQRMMDECGACVLPVHDSFLVQRGRKEDLLEVMEDEFLKKYGKPINMKPDQTAKEWNEEQREAELGRPLTNEEHIVTNDIVEIVNETYEGYEGWKERGGRL